MYIIYKINKIRCFYSKADFLYSYLKKKDLFKFKTRCASIFVT